MTYKKIQLGPPHEFCDVKCDNCEKDLETNPEHIKENGAWEYLQPDDALKIKLVGYYGGYFDEMYVPGHESPGHESQPMLFCKECADRLVKAFPGFQKRINNAI